MRRTRERDRREHRVRSLKQLPSVARPALAFAMLNFFSLSNALSKAVSPEIFTLPPSRESIFDL
jgi:hypothetical protein